jgi:hypothetical protein
MLFSFVMPRAPKDTDLRKWRHANRLEQKEVAAQLGISRSYYANIEAGQDPPEYVKDKLRELGYTNGERPKVLRLTPTPMSKIRIVGKVGAGPGEHNVDSDDEYASVPQKLAAIGSLAWIVEGESMMPSLRPGDIAIFKEERLPRKDYPMLVRGTDGEVRVKNMRFKNGRWVLESMNERFGDEDLGHHELVGVLVGWYRSFGGYEASESHVDGLKLEG